MDTERKYVLMVTCLNKDRFDVAGNKYPLSGFIKAKKFVKDEDIRYGLYGVPWGETDYFPYVNIFETVWGVVKTELSDNVIKIDYCNNGFKFRSGSVMHIGTIRSSGNFVYKSKNDFKQYFDTYALYLEKEQIAGTTKWFKKRKEEEKKINIWCGFGVN